MSENIAAIATPFGTGGIAVIRISGDGALSSALKMFKPSARVKEFVPNFMYPGRIICGDFEDYGFMVYFAAPKSFTGENAVEFHCHGGAKISQAVLKSALACGCRLAEAGEFSKRAFLNGKLTLASAEGMIDMINAQSSALLRAGSSLYFGGLTKKVEKLQNSLKDILAAIAAELDYPEEDLDGLDFKKIKEDLKALSLEISSLAAEYSCGKLIKSGVSVAICGKPNAGKSSLLNALLGYEKAIVSEEAGTTRDAVEGSVEIDGVKFDFFDTAGIREGAGNIELQGIRRAENLIRSADIVLFLTDGEPFFGEGKVITAFSKCDISAPHGKYDVAISSKTGEGLDKLKELLKEAALGAGSSAGGAAVIEERHYNALKNAEAGLSAAITNLDFLTPDLVAVDLRECWRYLGEITGETADEEIINTVFSKFCVGK